MLQIAVADNLIYLQQIQSMIIWLMQKKQTAWSTVDLVKNT